MNQKTVVGIVIPLYRFMIM